MENFDQLLKIVLVGDSGVGKTSIISRFTRNKFNPDSSPTIGVEFATKALKIDDQNVKTQLWDTGGQERFRAITQAYYRGALGAIILYDITSSLTFESVKQWLKEVRDFSTEEALVMLIGNKCDLKELRAISTEEGIEFAKSENLLFIETSAQESLNVDEAFLTLITEISRNQKKKRMNNPIPAILDQNVVEINSNEMDKEKSCC